MGIIRQKGRAAVVKRFTLLWCHTILLCRNNSKGDKAILKIKKENPQYLGIELRPKKEESTGKTYIPGYVQYGMDCPDRLDQIKVT